MEQHQYLTASPLQNYIHRSQKRFRQKENYFGVGVFGVNRQFNPWYSFGPWQTPSFTPTFYPQHPGKVSVCLV